MKKLWEIHFCEDCYLMAKVVGTESGIIDNTFTDFIGTVTATDEEMQAYLN